MTAPLPVHVIVGPQQHGVTRHAQSIADACGHPSLRLDRVDAGALDALDLGGATVAHVAFTDRLFARTAEDSAQAFATLAQALRRQGAEVSVTLHDLPQGHDPLAQRRRRAYAAVVAHARGVVVSAWHELEALEAMDCSQVHSLQVIPLPVDRRPGAPAHPFGRDAVVLGFVYPDRGYETILEALPPGSALIAIGQASAGHDDLPDALAKRAAELGRGWACTGFVPDAELDGRLRSAAVPIAPNPRPSASASIADWLARGRRPLVADSPLAREIDGAWPGAIALYDPADPAQLGALIEARLADPALTILPADVAIGPTLVDVARLYRQHLAASAPAAAIPIRGRVVVPGNRWDLAGPPAASRAEPTVSVVIPYFRDQRRLDLVLLALAAQTYPLTGIDVIVADDGSPEPPDVSSAAGLAVRVVRQPDLGFRAAAARNLGAAAADGDLLVFLDADTIPEPAYVHRLTRLPALVHDTVAVGRRRHADLTGWTAGQVHSWLTSVGPAPAELTEPQWLVDAYASSGDLLAVDARSYRFVISAVMAVSRSLFDEVGGFDERFVGYGGEDWELANRLVNAGAVLAHAHDAVAWHDGPDWAERDVPARTAQKNAETALLAALLPDPAARGGGTWAPYPEVVVTVPAADGPSTLATVRSGLAGGVDCGFWLVGDAGPSLARAIGDPRVHAGAPPADIAARARVLVELNRPADLRRLAELCAAVHRVGVIETPAGRVIASRAAARAARWADAAGASRDQLAVTLFGGHASRALDRWPDDLDLARVLGGL